MIRGINRQIIEVPDTESRYYEKAYFVVRPEFCGIEQAVLEREARKVIKQAGAPSRFRRVITRQKLFAAAGAIFLVASGVIAYATASGWFG